jgi:hypothetical protein
MFLTIGPFWPSGVRLMELGPTADDQVVSRTTSGRRLDPDARPLPLAACRDRATELGDVEECLPRSTAPTGGNPLNAREMRAPTTTSHTVGDMQTVL